MNTLNKINFLSLSLLLTLSSCGSHHGKKERSIASIGEEFSQEMSVLDSSSQTIALRICNALRSKRSYWHSSVKNKKATFQLSSNSCSNEKFDKELETTVSSLRLSDPIVFDSLSTDYYYKEVVTDVHGPLKQVCPAILSGDAPLAFYMDSNGQDRVYTQFSRIDSGSDRLILKYAELNSDDQQEVSGYKSYKSVAYDIVTTSKDLTFLGSVSVISEVEACEESGRQEEFSQILKSIL
ncbi:hypothetical protein [Halobacteriovorax marinus]|uniref:hypothetical protein n=1 Tax=Halobacteriovorax marinus TaxID=97084 RepID=UPI0012FD988F|nr:hypothetical protein [Halobacteriovorax marinus]